MQFYALFMQELVHRCHYYDGNNCLLTTDAQNYSQQIPLLLSSAGHKLTVSLCCVMPQLKNSSLFSVSSLLKPTWYSALHSEQKEIKLRSALVCWADLLPPYCYLIIQELWNVLLYGSMQPECLCLPLMIAASQSFHLCMRGCLCVCIVTVCMCVYYECHKSWYFGTVSMLKSLECDGIFSLCRCCRHRRYWTLRTCRMAVTTCFLLLVGQNKCINSCIDSCQAC